VGVSGLLPEPSGYAELLEQLEQLKARVRNSRVRAAQAQRRSTPIKIT